MASVPQRSEVTFPFRCLSLVLMGRYPYLSRWGGYGPEDHEAAVRAMAETDTLYLADRLITQVSGGEAQRVILARALAQSTEVLLLDEATSSLDAAKKVQVFDLLRRKNAAGVTILCAMHDLNLAALYCKRLLFLKAGRIMLEGTLEETFTDEVLSRIYETDIRISAHPVTGGPQAHFVPGAER
jgi:iron complex transport system ATP-binding protein